MLMADERKLLQLLADGCFHSGQDLAVKLGVSRSAVWKRLQHLQESLGIDLYAVSGKGYKLAKPIQLLELDSLQQSLREVIKSNYLPAIDIYLSTESTNQEALELARPAPQVPRLVLAERQTAGRGRRGRQWLSPFGGNLYLSLYWWFDVMPPAIGGLSLVAAMILARHLEAIGVPRCELKWPNDVRYQGRKLAGILLEMQGEAGGGCGIVIGMGVNLNMQGVAAEAIDQPWTDVTSITGEGIDRNQFTAQLVTMLVETLRQYSEESLAACLDEWQSRDVLTGQMVNLDLPNETVQGLAQGIDAQGAFLLEQNGQIRRFYSGEVSVRLAEQKR